MKKKSLLDWIFSFAGEKKAAYFLSVFFALLCVACAIAPYILIADIVKKLLSGVRDWNVYFHDCAIIAAFWLGNALDMPFGKPKKRFDRKNRQHGNDARAHFAGMDVEPGPR